MTSIEANGSVTGIKLAAVGGILAPLVFAIVVIAQGLQYSDYSHLELPISALAAWPDGWVQSLNFLVLGSGTLSFALALHRSVSSGGTGVVGPMLFGMGGVGLILAAAFPWQRTDGGFAVPSGHLVGAGLTFLGFGVGSVVISHRMRDDSRWRGMATYVLASGAAVLLLFLVTMLFARPEGAPLHAWLGLLQRLILLIWFPCMLVLSWRMIQTRAGAATVKADRQ